MQQDTAHWHEIARKLDNIVKRVGDDRLQAQSSDRFLRNVVVEAAEIIGADMAFISRAKSNSTEAVTIVFYDVDDQITEFSYAFKGTPCQVVLEGREVFVQLSGLQEGFPDDKDLVELEVCGYAGAPLIGLDGTFLGVYSFLFRDPNKDADLIESVLRHFAPQIASEIDRMDAAERLQMALVGSGTGIWDWDISSDDVRFDNFCREMLGYSEQELPNIFESWIEIVHPEERERASSAIRDEVTGDRPFDFTVRMKHRDGHYRWYRARARTTRSADGRAIRMLGTITDVDDLQLATQKALAASEAKSAFLANMSHEIRTPMNAVMGMLQMLGQSDVNEEQSEWVKIAYGSAESLMNVLNDILDLSRLEASKVDVEIADVDPTSILTEVRQFFAPLAAQKGIDLLVGDGGKVPLTVRGDSNRLRQILNNFLSNAIKFTADGSVTISAVPTPNGRVRLSVADTGPGIPDDVRQRLFRRFEQGDNSVTREFGGSGLGLAICKGLAERMNATLGVESELGRGSTFWIDLPVSAARNAA